MNVSLTPELERLVHQKVRSGMYSSAREVVQEALHLLNVWDELRLRKLEGLRKDVAVGLAQAERGEVAPLNLNELRRRLKRRLRQAPSAKK
jgi:antitoxin ParD1/3/4